MAIVDANYRFILCDIGTNGRVSDGGVIENTQFYQKLKTEKLNIPLAEKVENNVWLLQTVDEAGQNLVREDVSDPQEHVLNYVFVGDEAFTLRTDFLKPYSQRNLTATRRIFNYRLSRARRIVENAFGILANRFRIFHSTINLQVANIEKVVLACCALHNFLCKKRPSTYTHQQDLDFEDLENGTVRYGLRPGSETFFPIENGKNRQSSNDAKNVREEFEKFFNAEGAVSWQNRMIKKSN